MFIGFDLAVQLKEKLGVTLTTITTMYVGEAIAPALGMHRVGGALICGILGGTVVDVIMHCLATTGITAGEVLTGDSSDDDDDDDNNSGSPVGKVLPAATPTSAPAQDDGNAPA